MIIIDKVAYIRLWSTLIHTGIALFTSIITVVLQVFELLLLILDSLLYFHVQWDINRYLGFSILQTHLLLLRGDFCPIGQVYHHIDFSCEPSLSTQSLVNQKFAHCLDSFEGSRLKYILLIREVHRVTPQERLCEKICLLKVLLEYKVVFECGVLAKSQIKRVVLLIELVLDS